MKKQVFLIVVIVLALFSCETHNDKLSSVDKYMAQGNYEEAHKEIEKNQNKIYRTNKDEILYYLDIGAISFYAKNYNTSIEELTQADIKMDASREKSFIEGALASTVANDNVITYRGYNFEYVFTSLLLSLGYLAENDFDDGFVEIRRTQDKLTKIQVDNDILLSEYNKQQEGDYAKIKEIKTPFVDSAFARLMELWLYRADRNIGSMEVSARKYDDAIATQADIYKFTPPAITQEQLNTRGTRIQVVSLTDRSPILYSNRFSLNAVSGGLVVVALSEQDTFPPHLKPLGDNIFFSDIGIIPLPGLSTNGFSLVFDVPAMAVYDDKVDAIEVWFDEEKIGNLILTESLEAIAIETFKEESKFIYTRQLTRAVTKAATSIAAQVAGDQLMGGTAGALIGGLSMLAANATEKADLRINRYFPAKVWTGDFAVPGPGSYNVTIKYFLNSREVHQGSYPIEIERENDNFNLLIDTYL